MITSNKKYPFGPKIATIETPSFYCLITTIRGGVSVKSSVRFMDYSEGIKSRRLVAQLHYNHSLGRKARLKLHDVIVAKMDAAGMGGQLLNDALRRVYYWLNAEGFVVGLLLDEI